MKTIDCRNMTCPLPVITVKRALEEPGAEKLTVLLDHGPPRENVTRFARSRGYEVSELVSDDGITLVVAGSPTGTGDAATFPEVREGKDILVSSDRLGEGPEELGTLLMKNFIISLLESTRLPSRIFFINRGVMLTTEGSELLEPLEKLGNRGVEILSCGVCLDFFDRKDRLVAGSVTSMFSIVEALMSDQGAIRL